MKYVITYLMNSRYYGVKVHANSKLEAAKILLEMTEYKAVILGVNEFVDEDDKE